MWCILRGYTKWHVSVESHRLQRLAYSFDVARFPTPDFVLRSERRTGVVSSPYRKLSLHILKYHFENKSTQRTLLSFQRCATYIDYILTMVIQIYLKSKNEWMLDNKHGSLLSRLEVQYGTSSKLNCWWLSLPTAGYKQ